MPASNPPGLNGRHTDAYPRPLRRRDEWASLNGTWDFALDPDGRWTTPDEIPWSASIRVPFAPECPASGIGVTDFFRACWYRRRFDPPARQPGDHVLLHFGAVDYAA